MGLLALASFLGALLFFVRAVRAEESISQTTLEKILNPQSTGPDGNLVLQRPEPSDMNLAQTTTGQTLTPGAPLPPHRLALGINDLGAQLRFHLNRNWAAEMRFLTGSASSDFGTVRANVFGIRGYRFSPDHHRLRLYGGFEGAYAHTSIRSVDTAGDPTSVANASSFGQTSGYALGGFGGAEYRLTRRIAIDLDIGPYMIGLQESVTKVSDTTLDFVLNTAINVYLF